MVNNPRKLLPGVNDIFSACPEAEKTWDYKKNIKIDPRKETRTSHTKAYFKCKHGHSRYVSIDAYCKNPDCRECRQSVGHRPDMVKFWDYSKNTVDPWHVMTADKETTYHWKCNDCGFAWEQTAFNRRCREGKCANCGVQRKSLPTKKSLVHFSEYIPEAASLWIKAATKGITSDNVTGTSQEWITMKCADNPKHIYDIQICKIKPKRPYGCPYCTKQKIFPGEDLFSLVPAAERMWDRDLNKGYDDLTQIKPWSDKKAFFICDKGHHFSRNIYRFRDDQTCPKCNRESRKLRLTVGDVPHLLAQWDFDKNTSAPSVVPTCSKELAHWKCKKCGYTWDTQVYSRFHSKGECPCCETRTVVVTGINDLFSELPELKTYYHWEKNKHIDHDSLSVTTGNISCAWKCPKCDHTWKSSPSARVKGSKTKGYSIKPCPICAGKGISESYSEKYPELAKMYSKSNITAFDELIYGISSNTPLKWDCPTCGNTFTSSMSCMIRSMDASSKGCSYCSGKKVMRSKSFAALHPELMDEYDPSNKIDPFNVSEKSNHQVKWICRNNPSHKWKMNLGQRALGLGTCPICHDHNRGRRIIDIFPEFEQYYDSEKNTRPFRLLGPNSRDICYWKCDKGHQFPNRISAYSASKRFFCPYCENMLLMPGENDLKSQHPDLAEEFDVEKNGTQPDEICITSCNEEIWWKCKASGHEFQRSVAYRIKINRDCPICNNTIVIPGTNSLDDTDPDLAKEWSPLNNRKSDTVTKDSKISVFWRCPSCNEDYKSSVFDRSVGDDACPFCNGRRVKYGYNSLLDTNPELAKEWSPLNERKPNTVTKDFRLSVLWRCPVCNGDYHASISDRTVGDKSCPFCYKDKVLQGYNSLLDTEPELVKEWSPLNDKSPASVTRNYKYPVLWRCPVCRGDYNYIVAQRRVGDDSCPFCNGRRVKEGYNSLLDTDPELAKEWSPLNERKPNTVTKDFRLSVLWRCPVCNGEYHASISDRAVVDDSCPYCNEGRLLSGYNSLDVTNPELAKEWSPLNERKVESVTKDSKLLARWRCPTCHGDYYYSIAERAIDDDSCPYCNKGRFLKGYNSFANKYPDMLDEWDYISNYLICSPYDIADYSQEKVWWKCSRCGKRYELSPKAKIMFSKRQMESCIYCKGNRRKLKHYY